MFNWPMNAFGDGQRLERGEIDDRSTIRPSPVASPFGIRPGEGWMAWLFFAHFFVLACSQYAVKSVRQATYLEAWSAEQLPWVYLILALTSLPVVVLYNRLAGRIKLHHAIIGFSLLHGTSLAAFYWLFALPGRWVSMVFYVWATVAFGIAVSQLWSYAGQVFNPRQARRLFAFIGAGGLLGGIPGGLLARAAAVGVGTRVVLFISAGFVLLIVAIVLVIERRRRSLAASGFFDRTSDRPATIGGRVMSSRDSLVGVRTILRSRLLATIAGMMLLTIVGAQMVDLQFNLAIQEVTHNLDHRTAVFGSVFSAMGLVGLFFQLVFTRRLHRGLGVGISMRVLPLTVAVTTIVMIGAVSFVPAAIVAAAWFLKLGEGGLRHSIDQATRELLFLPVPLAQRRRGKAFIDVFVQRFSKGVAALVLLPVSFGMFGIRHVGLMTLCVVVVWLILSEVTRREYVRAFRRGLLSDVADDPAPIDLNDSLTLATLVEALGSSDPREVVHSLELLKANGRGRLVPPLLLHHDDPEVRRCTIEILAAEDRCDAAGLIEQSIGDPDAEVRRVAITALATLRKLDAAEMMERRLNDPDPRLRSAAVAFLDGLGEAPAKAKAAEVLHEMSADENPSYRAEAARALGQVDPGDGDNSLIQLLYDADRSVVREAIRAARRRQERGLKSPLRVPILISLMGDRHLKYEAREAIVAHGEEAVAALVLFMNSPDEHVWVRRAIPKTVALIGGRRAVEALMANLNVADAFLRAKVIESLGFLRRKHRIEVAPGPVRERIRDEAEGYLRNLVDLVAVSAPHQLHLDGPNAAWGREAVVPTLLQQFLARRMRQSVSNTFGLLELLHRPGDVRAAARSLLSGRGHLAARALEYLDNSLSGTVRRDVFAVIEDVSLEEKVRRATALYGLAVDSPEATMRRLLALDFERDPDAEGVVVATMYGAYAEGYGSLEPVIASLRSDDSSSLVQETAGWVTARMKSPGRGADRRRKRPVGGDDERREDGMGDLARIETMVFLQGEKLFSFCDADQMLRLAAITRELSYDEGVTIYRRGASADGLYVVVEGSVRLTRSDGGEVIVGPRDRFGVEDILSGRLRSEEAVAMEPTRVLVIDAEDFYDLLSNNIEIVKALFRQLTTAD